MIRMVAGSKTKPYGVGEIRSSHQLCPPSWCHNDHRTKQRRQTNPTNDGNPYSCKKKVGLSV